MLRTKATPHHLSSCSGLVAGLLVTLGAGLLTGAPVHGQTGSRSQACDSEFRSAFNWPGNRTLPNGDPFDIDGAMALYRFGRQKEALLKLDAARKIVSGPWRWRLPPDQRKEVAAVFDAFRNCIAATRAPELATVTVRTFLYDPDAPGERGAPPAGASVEVEGLRVGQTRRDGTLTVRVPSGEIRITAAIPPNMWGEGYVTTRPRGSGALSVVMDDGKEVSEDAELVLTEAVDDIIRATSTSFTLRFMQNGRPMHVTSVDNIDLLDRDGNFERALDELFTVAGGAIVAKSPAQVFDALAKHFGETITLQVDSEKVRFRVGQSGLAVTLAPPPSNPSLPVSKIAVGVSLVGAGIATERVSDAKGRFELKSFPHGTVAFECETVSEASTTTATRSWSTRSSVRSRSCCGTRPISSRAFRRCGSSQRTSLTPCEDRPSKSAESPPGV